MQAMENKWDLPKTFSAWSFLSYDCLPLPTKYLSAAEVLKFRDEAWIKYFSRKEYLDLVERKFGTEQKNNVIEMTKVKLKRKILGD
jgi:hypothetical protein